MHQTFFVPGWCMERYPHTVELLLEHGHEIGHHGYIHENPVELTRETERHVLERALESFRRFTGSHPKGWRAPVNGFSGHSLELLVEFGTRIRQFPDGRRHSLYPGVQQGEHCRDSNCT